LEVFMSDQSGISMVEVVVVLALSALALGSATAISGAWSSRERAGDVAYELQSSIQLARTEAVLRNRDCRVTIDTMTHQVAVWDGMGTLDLTDDTLLQALDLPASVSFERPDGVSPVTLDEPTPDVFQARLGSAGTVVLGAGEVGLHSGDRFLRLTLAGAGGLRVQNWNGAAWVSGQ
jgi:Tfp pilus assembly protein FimT